MKELLNSESVTLKSSC